MTSRLYHSLCLTSFTTGLLSDIVAHGDSIRALFGGIAENWPSEVQAQCLNCTPHVWRFLKIAWPWQQRPDQSLLEYADFGVDADHGE